MRYEAGTAKLVLVSLAIAVLVASAPAVAVDVGQLVPIEGVGETSLRWWDVASNVYDTSYREGYTYADATVSVTYGVGGNPATLAGHLSALNLKPNFAYQIKLEGKPTGTWGDDGNDAGNENIGFLGRWWRVQPSPGNSTDADYLAHRDDPAYIYIGYLVFDFFVTDSAGNAEVDFALDGSLHVLATDAQGAPETCDAPFVWRTVQGLVSDPAYGADVGPTDVGVYGVQETGRPCFGEAAMPVGPYDCRFILTEESFHQTGDGSGNWAGVMTFDQLRFDTSGALTLPDAHDYVDIGNPASEAGHALVGWGPIEPDTHPGNWGGIGTETPPGKCRVVWSEDEPAPVENWASLQMDFGVSDTETKYLSYRHLDGGSDDSFELFIDDESMMTVAAPPTTEVWYWAQLDVTGYTGIHTLKIVATAPPGPYYIPFGQLAIDKIFIGTQVTPVPVDAEPLGCGQTKRVDFHLSIDPDEGPFRGYSVRVRCPEGPLAFEDSDITVYPVPADLTGSEYVSQIYRTPGVVADNDWTIDYIILGDAALPDGLPGDSDLFSIVFRGTQEGLGQVIVERVRLGLLNGGPTPTVGGNTTSIISNCDPAAVPDRPQDYGLSDNYPNPFNPATEFSFALPEPQRVELAVFNVAGRRVATLKNELLPAGRHQVIWNGRDDAGQRLASGVYFYRLRAGGFSKTLKMTLIK